MCKCLSKHPVKTQGPTAKTDILHNKNKTEKISTECEMEREAIAEVTV